MSEQRNRFLKHKFGGSGFGGGYLKSWKKRQGNGGVWEGEGKLNVVLHRKLEPCPLIQHGMPIVRIKEENGKPIRHVWGGQYVCHEDASTIENRKRDQSGQRIAPFTKCGICRMIEWFRQQVAAGRISWTATAFRFTGDIESETQIIHVGGLYNAFGDRDLDVEKKAEMKAAGIFAKTAWRENAMAKENCVFCVVDIANVKSGVQTATETRLLGERVQDVINESIESDGVEDGDPFEGNPYVIQWQHRPEEEEFQKKYNAIRVRKIKITEEVLALVSGEAPDLTEYCAPFDPRTVRAILEKACCIKGVPWDELFKTEPPTKKGKDGWPLTKAAAELPPNDDESDEDDDEEEDNDAAHEAAQAKTLGNTAKPKVAQCVCEKGPKPQSGEECAHCGAEFDGEGYELQLCSGCQKPMRAVADTCPHCNKRYRVAANAVEGTDITEPAKVLGPETPTARKRRTKRAKDAVNAEGKGSDEDELPFP
jgi:hypothetical protein